MKIFSNKKDIIGDLKNFPKNQVFFIQDRENQINRIIFSGGVRVGYKLPEYVQICKIKFHLMHLFI